MKVTLNPTRLTAGKEKRKKTLTSLARSLSFALCLSLSLPRRGQALSLGFQRENIQPKRTQELFNKNMLQNDSGLMDRRCEVSGRANLKRSAKKIKKLRNHSKPPLHSQKTAVISRGSE